MDIIVISIVLLFTIGLIILKNDYKLSVQEGNIVLKRLWKKIIVKPDDCVLTSKIDNTKKIYGLKFGVSLTVGKTQSIIITTKHGTFIINSDDPNYTKVRTLLGAKIQTSSNSE